jgi:DNA-binding transcriptional regulator YiaG
MKPTGKYAALYRHLKRSDMDSLTLTFAEIEKLINGNLPISANNQDWWSNRKGALQACAWIQAGYEVSTADTNNRQVTFSKLGLACPVKRDETGAVLWDGQLIKALRRHMRLTQAQFAQELGVRQQTISEWEQGMYTPTRATAKHLMLVAEQAKFKLHK